MFSKIKIQCTSTDFKFVDFNKLESSIETFEKLIPRFPSQVVFAHNDLQYGNIMVNL